MFYDTILFVHVLGVVIMFVGVGVTIAAMTAMLYCGTIEQLRGFSSMAKKADQLLIFSLIFILLAGGYLVTARWNWGLPWVSISMLALIVMMIGPIINLQRINQIDRAANSSTELTPLLVGVVKNKVLWVSMSTVTMLAFAVVFLMTLKPGMAGSLIVFVAAAILGPICSSVLLKRGNSSLENNPQVQQQV